MLKDIHLRDPGAFAISIILVGLFALYEVAVLFLKVPADAGLSHTLDALIMLVAGYWIGSSSASKSKDAVIAGQLPPVAPVAPVPAPVNPAA